MFNFQRYDIIFSRILVLSSVYTKTFHNGDYIEKTKMLAWYSNLKNIKWIRLEVIDSVVDKLNYYVHYDHFGRMGLFGTLTNFKGMTFYFITEDISKEFVYFVKIKNQTLQFVLLETRLPLYCESIAGPNNNGTCIKRYFNRQLINFAIH